MSNIDDLIEALERRKAPKHRLRNFLAFVGVVAIIAGIIYAIYRYFSPDYLEDIEEEDFDDYFEDEDEVETGSFAKAEEAASEE